MVVGLAELDIIRLVVLLIAQLVLWDSFNHQEELVDVWDVLQV